jgi:chromosome segregation ATPase
MSNTKGTKRNTTKKAPTDALQSDKTTVTPKTTRATKPSVAALQKEIEGLKQQLVYSHQHVVRLKEEIGRHTAQIACLKEALLLSEDVRNAFENMPLTVIIYQRFTDWLYNVTKNFRE